MVSKHRHLDRLPVRKQRQRSDQTRRKIKLQIRTVAAIVSNGNLCSRRSRAFSRKRPPEWRRPLFPIGRGFSSRQSQFHIFERSNPVLSSGRGALWGAPEILSISTFAPASELPLRGGFLSRGRQFPFSSGRVRCYHARAVHADHRVQNPSESPLDDTQPSGGFSSPQIHRSLTRLMFRNRDLPLLHGSESIVRRMIALVRKFWTDETGATAIEYGLIAAGISLAIIAVVNGIGAKLNTKFASINTSLK
jgi:pilus assembly protein Flp/PilA